MISHIATREHQRSPIRIVGTSDAIRRVERHALLAAQLNTNVLITGERGAGKATLARFIHEQSDRSPYGFRRMSCKGLPDLLVATRLFGHVEGGFAGLYADNAGLLASIPGGTLLLDDVDALGARMQARLLSFLETGAYQPVGGAPVQTQLGIRVIASTAANLPALMAAGVFRNDLYRRLDGFRLAMPPLRERLDDIPSLVDYFAGQLAGRCGCCGSVASDTSIGTAMRIAVDRGEWPGNVQELRSLVQRQLIGEIAPRTDRLDVREPHCGLVH
jgi:DNA-binding NtrC family response regulator